MKEKKEYYENRELSWLKFDERVLGEAKDKNIPLFERLKFLSITASNLDEFYMVRVAALKDMVSLKYKRKDIAGMTPMSQLEQINKAAKTLVDREYLTYNRAFVPQLKEAGIVIYDSYLQLTEKQLSFIDAYFEHVVYPVLTPMAVDCTRAFPFIRNETLNIGALIAHTESDEKVVEFATVQVPSVLPRLVRLPDSEDNKVCFIFLENIIKKNIAKLFSNYKVIALCNYRLTRNAGFSVDEDDTVDLLEEIGRGIRKRQWGEVVRLEVDKKVDKKLLKYLKDSLRISKADVFKVNGPIDLTFLMDLYKLEGYNKLRGKEYPPQPVPEIKPDENIFDTIRKGDIFLHHPYETFEPVVDFIRQASTDPDVLAIKQTLYRVSSNSPIVAALAQAAENGKQVSVLVELKARFDEENNIEWAKRLEHAGCHVIYGVAGLKTHSKIALVVRQEDEEVRRYVHLATGNYNEITAQTYTDCGIFTCDKEIGEDATEFFNMLSGYSKPSNWKKLVVAPTHLRSKFLELIERETQHAKEGKEARIIAKMNSLCDEEIIKALYAASSAGVQIDLIVRGICSLKVGIPGVSENITVRSIVGKFLEHNRIFYFYNSGNEEFYMGSADWMPRNLDRRIEILFPLTNQHVKNEAYHILFVELMDNVKAWQLQPDGTYKKTRHGKRKIDSQMTFYNTAKDIAEDNAKERG